MFKTLRDLFQSLAPAEGPATASPHSLQLATAVMLVEVMRADAELTEAERAAVTAGLKDHFGLSEDENVRLTELADQTSRRASDFFTFTSQINDAFGMEDKLRMIEHMWRVAYADGTLSAHENHLMRRISDLLHIPHGAYVHAKMRARG